MRTISRYLRFWIFPVLLLLWYAVLIVRAACLHLSGDTPIARVEMRRSLPAARGNIYDRQGRPLAITSPGRRVFLDYKSVNPSHDLERIAAGVAHHTGRDADAVMDDFRSRRSRYIVQGIVYDSSVQELVTNKTEYSGVGLERVMVRKYPYGAGMAQVIGFVNRQQVGAAGIEQHYNRFLRCTDGYISGTRDGRGREIRDRRALTVSPVDGAHVHLTLDGYLQMELEEALAVAVAESGGSGGRAIIQLVRTGEILAMAELPGFMPEEYQAVSPEIWRNSNISEIYDPGSTMKTVIVAAAMNERLIGADSLFDVGQGSWFYGGYLLHDKVYGRVDVRTIIQKSSNIGSAQVGLMLGNKRMELYLRAFGFGRRLDVDLPGEESGILPRSERWDTVKPTRVAIGQGISVTPLQMLNAYCTIGNGGVRMRPYVVRKVVTESGGVIVENEPRVVGRPIRGDVAAEMLEMLTRVTETGGTGRRAAVKGYKVAGKTGTAQMVLPDGGYSNSDYWASFVGLVPADKPVFGILVIVDRPIGLHTGGVVAAPAFSRVAETTARYLELPVGTPEGVAGVVGE